MRTRSGRQEQVAGTRADQAEAAPPRAEQSAGGPSAGAAGAPQTESRRVTKASVLQQMLSAPEGATLAALSEATGWQAHTVRAALTRLRQAGHAVERSRSETGETVYRIRPAEGTAAETTVEETAVHGTTQTLGEAAAGGEPPTSAETSAA